MERLKTVTSAKAADQRFRTGDVDKARNLEPETFSEEARTVKGLEAVPKGLPIPLGWITSR